MGQGATATPEVEVEEQAQTGPPKLLPPYNLIIYNDDHITFEFVIALLMKVVKCTQRQAMAHAVRVHNEGRAIVWSGAKEWAEVKRDQIRAQPFRHPLVAGPERHLRCDIQPAA